MAEYLVKDTSLTAIADEIRTLSGTTSPMGLDAMRTNVATANTNVGTEADLIAQIASALEGKAAGGGDDTPTNVTLNFSWTATSSDYAPEVFYSFIDENGDYTGDTYVASSTTSGSTTLTVVKNSIIVIICRSTTSAFYGVYSYSTSDGIISLRNRYSSDARHDNSLFLINNNGDLTVSMGYHGGGGSND